MLLCHRPPRIFFSTFLQPQIPPPPHPQRTRHAPSPHPVSRVAESRCYQHCYPPWTAHQPPAAPPEPPMDPFRTFTKNLSLSVRLATLFPPPASRRGPRTPDFTTEKGCARSPAACPTTSPIFHTTPGRYIGLRITTPPINTHAHLWSTAVTRGTPSPDRTTKPPPPTPLSLLISPPVHLALAFRHGSRYNSLYRSLGNRVWPSSYWSAAYGCQ
jgi:hypothetical protein